MIRALAVLPLLLALLVCGPSPAQAASAADRGAGYLLRSLDRSGCAAEPGGSPNASLTAWVAIGLAATRRSAAAPARCLSARASGLRSTTDIELGILGLIAGGRSSRDASVRLLVDRLTAQIRRGRIGTTPASNQFGILALRALGRPIPRTVRTTLLRDQGRDGTWSAQRGGDGDSNLTASGITALVAAGVSPRDRRVRRALVALRRFRARSGGYALYRGQAPDAQSTAWVLQGLAAAGRRDRASERFLRRLVRADGAILYRRGMRITPVWVTAQGVAGLTRRPLPIRP